jgi:hypothetical protein
MNKIIDHILLTDSQAEKIGHKIAKDFGFEKSSGHADRYITEIGDLTAQEIARHVVRSVEERVVENIKVSDIVNNNEIKREPRDDLGDLMTLKEWQEAVKAGGFVDYDGVGCYGTETEEFVNREVVPSDFLAGKEPPKEATHVIWYNR